MTIALTEETITIPLKEYIQLQKDSDWLYFLEMAMLKQEQKESAPASSAILEDYVLVPVEPTGERLTRGLMALLQCSVSELDNYSLKLFSGYENDVRRVYLAMTEVTK